VSWKLLKYDDMDTQQGCVLQILLKGENIIPTLQYMVDDLLYIHRYKLIKYGLTEQVQSSKSTCQTILKCSGLQGWQVGRTKVFLKYQHAENLMAIINNKLHKIVIVQNGIRFTLPNIVV